MRYIPFLFQISKILDFIHVFPKKLVFRNFGSQKLKTLEFRNSHFVERVILHLFTNFVSISATVLELFWKNQEGQILPPSSGRGLSENGVTLRC